MSSLDFLTPREVIAECVRLAALPAIAVAAVGIVAWALFGDGTDEWLGMALVYPFMISALYGNFVIYNVRRKHGVRVLQKPWWYRLTGLAMAWTLGFLAVGLGVQFLSRQLGLLANKQPPLHETLLLLGGALAISLMLSLLPAKEQSIT